MPVFHVTLKRPDGRPVTIDVAADQHILTAALQAGIDLPYSCLQGWCLTCAARLCAGAVDQRDSQRYYDSDREDGFVLLCTGRPRSDVVVDTHARDAMRAARAARGLPFPRGDWGRPSTEPPM